MAGLQSPKLAIFVRVEAPPPLTKEELIQKLTSDKTLLTPRIIGAFRAVDRKDFVLPEYQIEAYEDKPLSIGYEATISQPTTVAFMLEKLFAKPDGPIRSKDTLRALAASNGASKILEIGTGSGYLTALLARIVGESGEIFSVEYIAELKEFAGSNLKKYNFKNINLFTGDGKKGLIDFAPFDKIISSASGDEIPKAWKSQLKIGGRIVAPLGGNLVVSDRISKRKFKEEKHPGFIFVPLQ